MKKRNSLIELYRFIFAMNVVKNHGFFPYQGKLFGPENLSVEFFFVLSGFFIRTSFDKYINLPYFKGLFLMLKQKLVALGIPLLISFLFWIPYRFMVESDVVLGYLWFVHDMFVIFIFYYTLRKFVRNEKIFFSISALLFVAASVFHAIPEFQSNGWFRAISSMSLGILVSYIPSIKLKHQWLIYIPLVFVWAYIIRMLFFEYSFVEEEKLNLLIFPALIYLTFQLSPYNKVLNYLGAISFGLYAYQHIPRLMRVLEIGNVWIYFIIIVALAVLTDGIVRIIRYKKSKTATPDYDSLQTRHNMDGRPQTKQDNRT